MTRAIEEAIVDFDVPREQLRPIREVRSTLVISSLQALRDHELTDAYFERLDRAHHATIRAIAAGVWVPIELAVAHYRACDALDLPQSTLFEIGTNVSRRVQGSTLATVLRLASSTGVTLWTGLRQFDRLYARIFVGGGVAVFKLGPKEARIEMLAAPLTPIAYFRRGLRGTITAGCEQFSRKVYVREIEERRTDAWMAYRISWV